MNLGSLKAPEGARKKRKRLGRGEGSGHGGTSTKGHKGQKARAGGFHKRGFEGGQMTLTRRLPKTGFVNIFRKEFAIVNVGDLTELAPNTVVDEKLLIEQGFVKESRDGIKILGDGELKIPLTFKLARYSEVAKKKIVAAGGQIVNEGRSPSGVNDPTSEKPDGGLGGRAGSPPDPKIAAAGGRIEESK